MKIMQVFQLGEAYGFHSIGAFLCAAISPDGKKIVTGRRGDGTRPGRLDVWDTSTFEPSTMPTHGSDWIIDVAFGPEQGLIASASPTEVLLWDINTWKYLRQIERYWEVACDPMAVSPNGKWIIGNNKNRLGDDYSPGPSGVLKAWDIVTGDETVSLMGQTGDPSQSSFRVVISSDGELIASATIGGQVDVWNAITGQKTLTIKGLDGLRGLSFSADGSRIVTHRFQGKFRVEAEAITVWDSQSGEAIFTVAGGDGPLLFSPDGTTLVAANNCPQTGPCQIQLLDTGTGSVVQTITSPIRRINYIDVARGSQQVVAGSYGGIMTLHLD